MGIYEALLASPREALVVSQNVYLRLVSEYLELIVKLIV